MSQPDQNIISDLLLSPRYRIVRHLALQTLLIFSTLDTLLNANFREPIFEIDNNRYYGAICYYLTLNITIYFNLYVLVPRYLLREKFLNYLMSLFFLVIFAMAMVAITQILFFPNAVENYNNLPEWFGGVSTTLNVLSSCMTIGLIITGTSAIVMIKCWISNNIRIKELQSNTLQSELKYLRNQINPHFLFNTLNNANVLIKRNPIEASKVLFKLEDLLRYQISESSRENVTLASEIRSLNDFLNLEKIRRDKLEYTLSKEGNIDNISLPPLLFIPFVENAVKYSFDSENPSSVSVNFKVWKNRLEFRCENTLPEIEIKKNGVGGLGLVNITRRLELLYPNRHLLNIEKTKEKYTVKLQITL